MWKSLCREVVRKCAERKKKATIQIGHSQISKREKSTRGDENCVRSLISALPHLLELAAAHAAVVEQHADVQMVEEASQHVQEARQRRKDGHVCCRVQYMYA